MSLDYKSKQTNSKIVALPSGLSVFSRSERQPLESLKKTMVKNGQNFMHWSVAPDALPGSAIIGPMA